MTPTKPHDVDIKIKVKGGPKRYKSGPRAKGREHFRTQIQRLMLRLQKWGTRTENASDSLWAGYINGSLYKALGEADKTFTHFPTGSVAPPPDPNI